MGTLGHPVYQGPGSYLCEGHISSHVKVRSVLVDIKGKLQNFRISHISRLNM